MMERLIEFGKGRVCPLKISHLEFAALTGIVFWNTGKIGDKPKIST
jgi:hypothetical protein